MKLFILIIAFLSAAIVPLSAKAQTTILENFMIFNCVDSFDKVPLIHDIKAKHDTLILNCHLTDRTLKNDFTLQACDDKRIPYTLRDITTMHTSPFSAINGRYLTVGSHSGIHHSGIALAAKENPLVPIPTSLEDNTIKAELPTIETNGRPLDLWLYAYIFEVKERLQLAVAEPDKLPYESFVNLVKRLENLGEWDGNPQSVAIPLHDFKADGFALIAQEKDGGPILALGKIEPGLASQISQPQN